MKELGEKKFANRSAPLPFKFGSRSHALEYYFVIRDFLKNDSSLIVRIEEKDSNIIYLRFINHAILIYLEPKALKV